MSVQKDRIEKFLQNKEVSPRDEAFAESLLGSLQKYPSLTPRQWSAFEGMESRYSPEVIEQRRAWKDSYTEEKRQMAEIAAKYYLTQDYGYYKELARKVLNGEILTEKQYNSFVNNKYAQKVIEGHMSEALFSNGSLVQFRNIASLPKSRRDRLAIVIDNSLQITSAVRGNKTYSVLLFGSSHPIVTEERYLRSPKKKK